MKRSEMIKKMLDWQRNFDYNTHPSEEQAANSLLAVLEQAGMSPPLEAYRSIEDCDLGLPEWEPEDETNSTPG